MTNSRDAEKVYSFPTRSKCPHCDTFDTRAVSTQGKVQYRQCRRIGCRRNYTVIGKEIKHKAEKEPKDDKKTKVKKSKAERQTHRPGTSKKPAAKRTGRNKKGTNQRRKSK